MVDYAGHIDGKGRIKDVDEFIADDQAARRAGRIDDSGLPAATQYRSRRKDVEKLLDMLREEVAHHAEFAAKEPGNWGCVGDMGHTRELLVEVMSFLAQQDAADIERRLNPN